jgi:hypothetical protein
LASGDAAGAAALIHEALKLARDLGDTRAITECFEAFAMLLSATGKREHARAARLLAAANQRRERYAEHPRPSQQKPIDRVTATVRAALRDDAFAAAWAAGQAATLDQILAELEAAALPLSRRSGGGVEGGGPIGAGR